MDQPDREAELHFTQPYRQILTMIVVPVLYATFFNAPSPQAV